MAGRFFFAPVSLRGRIVLIVTFSSLVPFLTAVVLAASALDTALRTRIQSVIESRLHVESLAIDNALDSLNRVAQQLGTPGATLTLLESYVTASSPAQRVLTHRSLSDQVSQTVATNPLVSLALYWWPSGRQIDFETNKVRDGFTPTNWPVYRSTPLFSYHIPHRSQSLYSNRLVLSLTRSLNDDAGSAWPILYVEAEIPLTTPGSGDKESETRKRLILDSSGLVVYTDLPAVFPMGSVFHGPDSTVGSGQKADYYWTANANSKGLAVVDITPRAEYDSLRTAWVALMGVLGAGFAVVVFLSTFVLWRWIYRPLRWLDGEMGWLESSTDPAPRPLSQMREFTRLLDRFDGAKRQVADLMDEIREKERTRADLEVQKLRHQINPHFLLNSLNTIHWHAVMSQQPTIDGIATTLMRLLHYNLREGDMASLGEELRAIQDYVTLQQTRFDFRLNVHVENEVVHCPVPRFILQPIVENSISHGLREGGVLALRCARVIGSQEWLRLEVEDEGSGNYGAGTPGLGIGLAFVRKTIEHSYRGRARLLVERNSAGGTTVVLELPFERLVAPEDQR